MALDFAPQNVLPTPENYATQEQVKSMQDYVNVLRNNSTQPVSHWSQGVANMANALMGGYLQEQMRRAQQGTTVAGQVAKPLPAGTPQAQGSPQPNFQARSTSNAPSGADASADPMAKEKGAISGIESGGRYDAEGPTITSGPYAGDRAYGKYQVMGKNIPQWTAEVLGHPMTPEQFKADPSAQERVFEQKFAQLEGKYGPESASKAWFAGEKGMNNPNAKDQLGTTVSSYADKFKNIMGGPPQAVPAAAPAGAGPALAFNGQTPPAPAQQAIAAAARGGTEKPPVINAPNPSGQQAPYYNPALVPQRPQVSREQYIAVMSNPFVSPQEKALVETEYQAQNLPQALAAPGGTIMVSPRQPNIQQFIPEGHWGTSKIGTIEHPVFQTPASPGGPLIQSPISTPPPPPIPTAPQRGGALPGVPGQPPANVGQNGPAAPAGGPALAFAPQAPQGAPTPTPEAGKPVQLASLGTPTSDTGATPPSPIPAAAPPSAAGKVAQAGGGLAPLDIAPPGVSQADWEAYRKLQGADVDKSRREEYAKGQAQAYGKRYEELNQNTMKASDQIPLLQMAKSIVNDPRFYSGIGNDLVLDVKKLQAALQGKVFGDQGAQFAAAPMEMFRKIASGSVLSGLRAATQGTGQVRLAEIHLLQQATLDPHNSVAANKALVDIALRSQQRLTQYNDMAQDYISGNAVTDPITGKEILPANAENGQIKARDGLDPGYDRMLTQWIKAHPLYTPEETKAYEKTFSDDKNIKPGEEGKATPTDADINYLTAHPEVKDRFEKQFGAGSSSKYLKQPQAK